MRAKGKRDFASLPFLIGFGAPEREHQAVVGFRHILNIEGSQFRAPETAGETEHEQSPVAGALQILRAAPRSSSGSRP